MDVDRFSIVAHDSPVENALRRILPLLGRCNIDPVLKEENTNGLRLGLMCANNLNEACEKSLSLLKAGCIGIIIFGDEETASDPKSWSDDKRSWPLDDTNNLFRFCDLSLGAIIETTSSLFEDLALAVQEPSRHKWYCEKLRQKIEAIALFSLLEQFSHDAKDDIVNSFLAPARMLCKAGNHYANKMWFEKVNKVCNTFEKVVIQNIRKKTTTISSSNEEHTFYGEYGFKVLQSYECIDRWCRSNATSLEEFGDGQCLETLMDLMTEIRTLAGEKKSGNTNSKSYEDNRKETLTTEKPTLCKRKILVIDDHAESWLPCFKQIKKQMEVEIDIAERPVSETGDSAVYSLDEYEIFKEEKHKGNESKTKAKSLSQSITEYDLVLLDIFYSTDKITGLEFLREIRSRRIYVPVILWTTSRDKDLPAKAVLANGYLYKKEADINVIISSLLEWMEHGRGNRETPLMHPFFSHVIVSPKFRELAENLTHWCLKLAGSFHAIDSTFFRYFNDHGGRHIWGVMIRLKQLLYPYLLDRNDKILPWDRISFEKEIFAFYIAAICHDLGMFPFRFEREAMSKSPDSIKDIMLSIRKLHSLRGLTLVIPDSLPSVAEDPEFSELISILNEINDSPELGPSVLRHAGLLILYHSSFLDLKDFNKPGFFGKLTSKAKGRIKEYNDFIGSLTTSDTVYNPDDIDYTQLLQKCFEHFTGKKLERLQKQCAIFMLADELDIEWTRLPANFLMSDPERNPRDDTENFKRQIIDKISVQQDQIKIKVRCGAPSNEDEIKDFVKSFAPDNVGKASIDVFCKWMTIQLSFLCESGDCTSITAPFDSPDYFASEKDDFEHKLNAFEKCLENFFSKNASERTEEHKAVAAWVAVLWVICELREKFQITKSLGLEELDIHRLEWMEGNPMDALSDLTILDQEPAKGNSPP